MEIVKTKGAQDKFLLKDVKIILGELENLKRLSKSKKIKRVFYRTCPTFGRRLIPFPSMNRNDYGFLPKVFAGDVLMNSEKLVESVLLKFVLTDERVIPIHEWYEHTKERISRLDELELYEDVGAFYDPDELEELRLEMEEVALDDFFDLEDDDGIVVVEF